MLSLRKASVLLPIVSVFSACVYSLSGFFPKEYKYIALLEVNNDTDNLQMTAIARDVFNNLVIKDTRLQLKDVDGANVLARIYVEGYDRKPEKYDQTGNIKDYRYMVRIGVEFLRKDTSVLIQKTSYTGTSVLDILAPQDSAYKLCIEDALRKAFTDYFNKLSEE